jgi:predicted metalloprotease with PDZ domain
VILAIDGTDVRSAVEVEQAIRRHKPGDDLSIVFERRGQRATGRLRLEADAQVEIVSAETAGRSPSAEQRRARDEWLSSAARNVF